MSVVFSREFMASLYARLHQGERRLSETHLVSKVLLHLGDPNVVLEPDALDVVVEVAKHAARVNEFKLLLRSVVTPNVWRFQTLRIGHGGEFVQAQLFAQSGCSGTVQNAPSERKFDR